MAAFRSGLYGLEAGTRDWLVSARITLCETKEFHQEQKRFED